MLAGTAAPLALAADSAHSEGRSSRPAFLGQAPSSRPVPGSPAREPRRERCTMVRTSPLPRPGCRARGARGERRRRDRRRCRPAESSLASAGCAPLGRSGPAAAAGPSSRRRSRRGGGSVQRRRRRAVRRRVRRAPPPDAHSGGRARCPAPASRGAAGRRQAGAGGRRSGGDVARVLGRGRGRGSGARRRPARIPRQGTRCAHRACPAPHAAGRSASGGRARGRPLGRLREQPLGALAAAGHLVGRLHLVDHDLRQALRRGQRRRGAGRHRGRPASL